MSDIDVVTYGDDKALGVEAPPLSNLDFIRGEKQEFVAGKIYVLYYFNTFYKGAFPVMEEFTKLTEKYADQVVFIAISNDAEKEKAEKILTKEIKDVNTGELQRMGFPNVAFDPSKATAKLYSACFDSPIMSCPMAFIVGKDGKIEWRQQFLQTFGLANSNFEVQLAHVLSGEKVELAGPRPVVEVEGEAAEVDDMALF